MTNLSRQALVGDIGHTNIRFAITDIDELTISNYAYLSTAMFSGPAEALQAYLRSIPQRPSMLGIAVAGPVRGEVARLSHLNWTFSADDFRSVLDAPQVRLFNDFEALALVLPHLTDHDLHKVGGGEPQRGAPRVVVGPGTELEIGTLIDTPTGGLPLVGQGGCTAFGAQSKAEMTLLSQMRPDLDSFAAGDVISSRGLAELYRALKRRKSGGPGHLSAPEVVKAALVEHDPVAEQAVTRFAKWLGRFAGDAALFQGAAGGVYVAGGMAPRMVEALAAGSFRDAFEDKGPAAEMMASIPTYVVKAADACLRGAAVALGRIAQADAGLFAADSAGGRRSQHQAFFTA